MSWSDAFFDNSEKREQVIRKNQELRELMKNNFRATNQLIEILNKHLGLNFTLITLNNDATIKENCDVMIKRMDEIRAKIEEIDKVLKEKLDSALYENLRNLSASVKDYKAVSLVVHGVCGLLTFAAPFVIGWLIKSGRLLTNVTSTCARLCCGSLSSLTFGMLFLAIDIVIQIILGKKENNELIKILKEYDEALKEFRPASEKFQDNLTYVRVKLERILQEGTV
ncbi:SMCO3 protein, partial [Atractosteus spatula]|nr:SMCO3 protein [Atractosteus spatula]